MEKMVATMRKLIIFLLAVVLNIKLTCGQNDSVLLTLPIGQIEGFIDTSLGGHLFYSFIGVPYASPPVGNRRFREPLPVKPWNGTLQAKTVTKCLQYIQWPLPGDDPVIGDEDCLHVNIFTPVLNQSANLDVIVFIHGGAFMFHYGAFQEPHYLMDREVVYVSLNYRLGPLGFLSTEDDVVPGNNGIKDQIMALRWVKDNIRYFGGNPGSVTITGNSAGGASVQLHYLTAKSRGLFHKGISQSGTALNPWVLMENPLEKTKAIAVNVGCPVENLNETVECLRGKPGHDIVSTVKLFQPFLYNPFSPFGVVVDTWSSDPLFPNHPYNLLKNQQVADLPWIASYVSTEGLYPGTDLYDHLPEVDGLWNEVVPHILHYNETVEPTRKDVISQIVRKFYLGDKAVDRASFLDLVQILSDRLFVADIEKATRLQAMATNSSVYGLYFSYRGAHSGSEPTAPNLGVAHMDDAAYVFKTTVNVTSTAEDRLMVNLMVGLFSSFAATGKPNVTSEWLPVSKQPGGAFAQLNVNSTRQIQMEYRDVIGNRLFWESLPLKENEFFSNEAGCQSITLVTTSDATSIYVSLVLLLIASNLIQIVML